MFIFISHYGLLNFMMNIIKFNVRLELASPASNRIRCSKIFLHIYLNMSDRNVSTKKLCNLKILFENGK